MRDDRYSDEALRAAFRTLVDEAEDRGGPDAGRIWDAIDGSSPAAERRKVVDEIAQRPGAALFWRLARELQADREPSGEQDAAPPARPASPARPTVDRRLVKYAAWAAAAAVVLAVGTWATRPGPTAATETPSYRSPDQGHDQGGHGLDHHHHQMRSEVPGERALDRSRFLLRWSPAVDGALYDVRVMTESLVEIASARDLARPELLVPSSRLRALAPGSRVLWQVTARPPSGAEVRSETFVSVIQ